MEGLIVWFNTGKGYGFIACGAKQIFFHVSNFAHGFQPVAGRRVQFDIGPGLPGKSPMATNVRYTNGDTTEIEQTYQKLVSLAGVKESESDGGAR
jgi:cold shock CspA family protein